MSSQAAIYTGRFAPSPSGPLHMGSLLTALASYLDARANQGRWLLRMEDLDPPRESPEAADAILQALDSLELHWDGSVLYQSSRLQAYDEAIHALRRQGLCFACRCTRPQIQAAGGIYPGTCRRRRDPPQAGEALRCQVSDETIAFEDIFQGRQAQNLEKELGDFVIKRKDGLHAYQLAVVVDDAFQNVTHVIRGCDLLDSTARQIYLQGLLNAPTPRYGHLPILVDDRGDKLSKQQGAAPLALDRPEQLLFHSLLYLQQNPPTALKGAACEELLSWAVANWQRDNLQGITRIREFGAPAAPGV